MTERVPFARPIRPLNLSHIVPIWTLDTRLPGLYQYMQSITRHQSQRATVMRPYHIVNTFACVVMAFIVGAIVCAQKDRTIARVTAEYHNAR